MDDKITQSYDDNKITFHELIQAKMALQPLIDKLNPHMSIIVTNSDIRVVADEIGLPYDYNGLGFERKGK